MFGDGLCSWHDAENWRDGVYPSLTPQPSRWRVDEEITLSSGVVARRTSATTFDITLKGGAKWWGNGAWCIGQFCLTAADHDQCAALLREEQ